MLLSKLLHNIVPLPPSPDIEITHLCNDSRQARRGSLFFARQGAQVDGAQFITAAQKGGAVAIIHDATTPANLDIPAIRVGDINAVQANIAARFFDHPSTRFHLCGITGTNGKTTITYLLEKFWSPARTGVIGTVNFRYGEQVLPAPNTTPDSLTLQSLFADMVQHKVTHVALEVSSIGLEQKRTKGCQFDSAVFTNLTQDHLDYHQSMEEYYQAKKLLFTEGMSSSSKKNKLAVINIDDPAGERLCRELAGSHLPIETFSTAGKQATASLEGADYQIEQTRASVLIKGKKHTLTTNLLGEHNLKNILTSLLVGWHSGCDMPSMLKQLVHFTVPGRLERVPHTRCFVDYAHTPDALTNVITAIRQVLQKEDVHARLLVVFGCGGDRDHTKRPLMGAIVACLSDVSIVTSDNPRTESPRKIIDDILPGITKNQSPFEGTKGYLIIEDRRQAIHHALELATAKDVVLIAGKGHEDYQIIGTQKTHFDDREVVREWMEKRKHENTRDEGRRNAKCKMKGL
ncbi:MAG TPA: UDP-N-acetylmuramoyl-L-alanyl-D-glutamate--2,6-diaminopimelate ligase [bacterium]|nr:UDP-N-acetylmuramoyl-L-alanyl-D-glutamate--2,6-diaminopimelate ligase [bacterium]